MNKHTFSNLLKELKPLDEESKIDELIDELLKIKKWDNIDFAFAKSKIVKSIVCTEFLEFFNDKWKELDLDDMIVYQAEKREKLKRQKEANERAKKKSQNEKKEKADRLKKKKKKKRKNKKKVSKGVLAKVKKSSSSTSKQKESTHKQQYVRIIYTPMRG